MFPNEDEDLDPNQVPPRSISSVQFLARAIPAAMVVSLLLTWVVHSRAGDETFLCDAGPCVLGSGASWIWTGAAVVSPLLFAAGITWSRRLHMAGRLGPFSYRRIPDGEELAEGLSVIVVGLVSWWLVRNGAKLIAIEVGFPNDQLSGRVGRRPLGRPLVPARFTWFLVGALLSAPFGFSLGSMTGREWYGRRRRKAFDEDLITLAAEGDEGDD